MEEFEDFTPDNDPHGEHDFGIIKMWGESFYWKIDYCEQGSGQMYGSEDPSSAQNTRRVLSLMHSSEH
jgi:hypothetical protein